MTDVIINDILPLTQAIASFTGQTVYSTNWTAESASDVIVFTRATGIPADDATQQLALNQYTVAFIGALDTVQVTLINPSTIGDMVTITRMTPADRLNLYSNTNFTPTMLNNDFGILTLVDQQAQLVNDQVAPRYNYSEFLNIPTDTILPILPANSFWAKNGANTAIIAVNIEDVVSGGTVYQVNTGSGLTGGPITTIGTISLANIANNDLLANTTGNTSQPIPTSLTALIDSALGNTQGDILYRSATAWTVLAPGTSGQVLTTQGAAANPMWGSEPGTGTVTSVATNNGLTGGTITTSGTIGLAAIANNTLLANISGGSLYPSSTTLTALIDSAIDNTQGDILYRNGTVWTFLSPGTAGQVLSTGGAAANPSWASVTGSVSSVGTGTGLTGGPITTTGTISFAAIAGVSFWANITGVSAVPTVEPLSILLQSANDLSDVGNANLSFNNISPANLKGDLIGFSTTSVRIPVGTNGQLLQANSAAVPGVSWTTSTFPLFAGSVGTILRSDGTNWVTSTATFANTYSASNLLYSNGSNTVTGLATANNGLLVTSSSGVPSILVGPGTTGNMLLSNAAAAPSFSTSTIPSSAGATANKVLLSDGTNYVLSTPTFPNASASSRKIIVSDGTNWVASTETYAVPGTSGNVLTSDGTNWTSAAPVSTVNSGLINQLAYYAAAGTAVSGVTIVNSAVLTTTSGGVPTWVAYTGTGSPVLATSPTLVTPTLGAATATSLGFGASATNGIIGVTGATNASAGVVGEVISSSIVAVNGVSVSPSAAVVDITSIILTAGDWDVWGNVVVIVTTGPTTEVRGWTSTTSATYPDASLASQMGGSYTGTLFTQSGLAVPFARYNVSGSTNVYLSGSASFSGGSVKLCGNIFARRVR